MQVAVSATAMPKVPGPVTAEGAGTRHRCPAVNGGQSVTVTVPSAVHVQGTLSHSKGNVYTSQDNRS